MPKPLLFGILNITPDSFSDGGCIESPEAALNLALKLLTDGADVIDIGAESTRPGATPLTSKEEWARLEAPLKLLTRDAVFAGKLSIDTRHAETAARALDLGVAYINDVGAGQDSSMLKIIAPYEARYIFMHSLSVPADPNITLPLGVDPVSLLQSFAIAKRDECADAGISEDRLIFDPGIGFSKTPDQSLEILRRVQEFKSLEMPLLIGHSRKSFLKLFTQSTAPKDRDALTLTASMHLTMQGVEMLRVHNVAAHFEMLKLWQNLHA